MTRSLRITLAALTYIIIFLIILFLFAAVGMRCDNADSVTIPICGFVAEPDFLLSVLEWLTLFGLPLIPGWIIMRGSKKKEN